MLYEVITPDLEVVTPVVPIYPGEAWLTLEQMARTLDGRDWGVVGSSLGGYWATALSQRYGCPAVFCVDRRSTSR